MSYSRDTSEDLVWNSSTNSYESASESSTPLALLDGNGNVYVLNGSVLVTSAPEPETVTLTIEFHSYEEVSGNPESMTVNGNAITILPSTVTVNSGESCIIVVNADSNSHRVWIYVDETLVEYDNNTVTYTFTPTENHTIGVGMGSEKG